MIYKRSEYVDKYGVYEMRKSIKEGKLFKIVNGYYSDNPKEDEIEIISKRYPSAVFTMESAFYILGLTKVKHDKFFLATKRESTRIKDENIKQYFIKDDIFDIGITILNYKGVDIKIYDKERLLIELIRNRSTLSFDYYKEIIRNYRKIINKMDGYKLVEYLSHFKNGKAIYEKIMYEVY